MLKCYLNGEIMPENEAKLGVNDLALLRGYGVFDYFVFERFQASFLEENIDRLYRSAGYMHLECPVEKPVLRQAIHQLMATNERPSGAMKIVLTGGYSPDGYTPAMGNLFLLQSARPVYPDMMYENGRSVATYRYQREVPEAKSINYMTGIYLIPWLRERKSELVLFHDGEYLLESDRSNFFMIDAAGTLVTPKKGILEGITRKKVLQLAPELGLKTEVRAIKRAELGKAQEVFLTNTTMGIMPITIVDGTPVHDGQVGAKTKAIRATFLNLTMAEQVY